MGDYIFSRKKGTFKNSVHGPKWLSKFENEVLGDWCTLGNQIDFEILIYKVFVTFVSKNDIWETNDFDVDMTWIFLLPM